MQINWIDLEVCVTLHLYLSIDQTTLLRTLSSSPWLRHFLVKPNTIASLICHSSFTPRTMSAKSVQLVYGTLLPEIWIEIAQFLAVQERILLASASRSMSSLVYYTPAVWPVMWFNPKRFQKADDKKVQDLTSLASVLRLRLSTTCKSAVRSLILNGKNVTRINLEPLLINFPNIEILSLRGCCSSSVLLFALWPSVRLARLTLVLLCGTPWDNASYSSTTEFLDTIKTHLQFLAGHTKVVHDLRTCGSCKFQLAAPDPEKCLACGCKRTRGLCIACGSCAKCGAAACEVCAMTTLLARPGFSDDESVRCCPECIKKFEYHHTRGRGHRIREF